MTLHTTEDGTSDMTLCTTEVDDTVSVTATSDIPTNTQDSLQGLDEDSSQDSEDGTPWCYCQKCTQGELVGCDNPSCKINDFICPACNLH